MKWNILYQITATSRIPDEGGYRPRSPFCLSSTEFVEPPPPPHEKNSWVSHCPPLKRGIGLSSGIFAWLLILHTYSLRMSEAQHGRCSLYVAQYGHNGKESNKASKAHLQNSCWYNFPSYFVRSSETFDIDYIFRPENPIMEDSFSLVRITGSCSSPTTPSPQSGRDLQPVTHGWRNASDCIGMKGT